MKTIKIVIPISTAIKIAKVSQGLEISDWIEELIERKGENPVDR